ncbi:MAG: nitroreductase [Ignavibacteria bacterium]|nr:nitroreductase [Ignavibacteria bacterium]
MDKFEIVSEVIRSRRTIKPSKMNGKQISDEDITDLLKMADWAPSHKHTEPWRFIVHSGNKASEFVISHAELYKKSMPNEKFSNDKYEKLLGYSSNLSHLIAAVMKRDPENRIPELEEICAASAAVQNLLISASAKGIASFWSTGGMTHTDEMKQMLGLSNDDIVIGLIYLGYSDHTFHGKRVIPFEEKIKFIK